MGLRFPAQLSSRRAVMLFIPMALALLLVWLLLPTAGVTRDRVAKLHPGMTHEEVEGLMGEPDDTTMYSGSIDRVGVSAETWVYRVGNKRLTLRFSGGRLTAVENGGL